MLVVEKSRDITVQCKGTLFFFVLNLKMAYYCPEISYFYNGKVFGLKKVMAKFHKIARKCPIMILCLGYPCYKSVILN